MSSTARSLLRAQNHLKSLYRESRDHKKNGKPSWHYVALKMGLSVGTVIRVIKGIEPKSARIRHALSLPVYETIPACMICGRVHLNPSKVCPIRNRERRYRRMPIAELPTRVLAWKLRHREETL